MTDYTVSMNQVLDTHQAVKELVGGGFAEKQAEAIVSLQVRFVSENVANKQDIELIRKDIELIRHDVEVQRLATQKDIEGIHKDIEIVRKDIEGIHKDIASIHKDIAGIHKDIESLRAEIKKDMQIQSSQLTLRMGGMLTAGIAVLASLQTFGG